jgi:putative aldouronate transport system substrate-binding protein
MMKKRITGSILLAVVVILITALLAAGCQPAQTTGSAATTTTAATTGTTKQATTTTAKENLNATGLPIVDQPITLTALVSQDSKQPDWNEHPALLEMKERTNIDVQWECVPSSGFAEKRNLVFATNDLPDFIMRAGLSAELEIKYATSGQIVALDTLFDYAPHYGTFIESSDSYIKNIQSPDGHIYSMPMIFTIMGGLVNNYWINETWLKNLNLPMPTTTEELYQTLKAFVTGDANQNGKADELGLSGPYKSPYTLLNYFHGAWGFGKNSGIIANFFDVDDTGKVRLIVTDPNFKDELMFFNKLWRENLIDKDSFSQDASQVTAKADADTVGFIPNGNNTQFIGSNRDNFVQPPSLKGPAGHSYWVNTNTYVYATGCAVITSACDYPREAMRWIDYLYSEDGTILVRLGIEGKSYQINADGKYELLDHIKNDPTGLTQDQALAKWTLYHGGGMVQYAFDKIDLSAAQLPAIKQATETLLPDLIDLGKIPRLHFTVDESTSLSYYANDIQTYLNENIINFITDQRDLATWDSYIADLNKMNAAKYTEVYQAAYERWLNG